MLTRSPEDGGAEALAEGIIVEALTFATTILGGMITFGS
jgi:hypothetical protein